MRVSTLISTLTFGLLAVNAFPHSSPPSSLEVDASLKATRTSQDETYLRVRDVEVTAPTTTTIAGHSAVLVPMLYAAWMDASTGAWERYECDGGVKKPVKLTGTAATVADRQLATGNLATCMDINLISRTGAIKAHIPPFLCQTLKGYTGNALPLSDADKLNNAAMKSALKSLLSDHKSKLGKFTAEVIAGQFGSVANMVPVMNELFDVTLFSGIKIEIPVTGATAVSGTTRINLGTSPPTFFVQEVARPITIPN